MTFDDLGLSNTGAITPNDFSARRPKLTIARLKQLVMRRSRFRDAVVPRSVSCRRVLRKSVRLLGRETRQTRRGRKADVSDALALTQIGCDVRTMSNSRSLSAQAVSSRFNARRILNSRGLGSSTHGKHRRWLYICPVYSKVIQRPMPLANRRTKKFVALSMLRSSGIAIAPRLATEEIT